MRKQPDDAGLKVAVITAQPTNEPCPTCGKKWVLFNAQCFAEPERPIITACKVCIIVRAGGEAAVFIKTARKGLGELWHRNRRSPQPERLKNRK